MVKFSHGDNSLPKEFRIKMYMQKNALKTASNESIFIEIVHSCHKINVK